VHSQTGLDGIRALLYHLLIKAGWDDVSARQMASVFPHTQLDRYY